jgi:hypothetical protein
MNPMAIALNTMLQQKEKARAVGVINEDAVTAVAAQHDVIKGTRVVDTGFT